jgi:hypothetical protein
MLHTFFLFLIRTATASGAVFDCSAAQVTFVETSADLAGGARGS